MFKVPSTCLAIMLFGGIKVLVKKIDNSNQGKWKNYIL